MLNTIDTSQHKRTMVLMKRTTTSKTNPTIAIAYLRASKDEQALSPEAQRASIEAWATRSGATVVAWHSEHLCGATSIEQRPALLSAIDALAAHDAGVLVVAKRDRLARDVIACAMIERLAARHGARVVSAAGEGTDADDPSSLLMRRMVDAFAEYERQVIKARTRAALGVKRARGERVGVVSYGFQLDADGVRLVPCEAEQAVIATVREYHQRGLSLRAIVAELAAAGVAGRTGRALAVTQVRNLVQRVAA